MIPRIQAIYDEIEALKQNEEDPDKWVGFIHPSTYAELRHPSSPYDHIKTLGAQLFLGGLEVRPNELVQRGEVVLIDKELIYDEGEGVA